jgi:hypothetical protein
MTDLHQIPLYRLAHGRTGDKGDRSNMSLIAYEPEYFDLLVEHVTEERVAEFFRHRKPSKVTRYVLNNLGAMNFVLDNVLDGGVNDSLNLDTHGKALVFSLLEMPIPVSMEQVEALKPGRNK